MTVATALISGNDPLPQLAEEAVRQALARAGLSHANGVLLFLTPEFARHAQQSVTAAARAAQCTQIAGGIASGVFTESGWALDRPAAAAMVFGQGLSLGHSETEARSVLSYAGGDFPTEWCDSRPRFGGGFSGNFAGSAAYAEPVAWQQSRLAEHNRCEVQILGADTATGVSSGLQLLGQAQLVERSSGFDVHRVGGQSAHYSLEHSVPPAFCACNEHPSQHLHRLAAVLVDDKPVSENALTEGCYRPIAILSANPDNSLTLAERIEPGQHLAWAIRQPATAEADMQQTIDRLAESSSNPACALMFSCIGRGPYFYGGDDHDLDIVRQRFPGLPILGTYGTGQIAPANGYIRPCNHHLQNAVVTTLISKHEKMVHV